jgi:hypothetical protein
MPRRSWVSWLVAVLPIALGLFGVVLALLPYGTLRAFTDSLMPDHNFNSLKSWNAGVFKVIFGTGGLVFLGLAALTGLRRWNLIGYFFKQLWADGRRFFASLRPQKDEFGFLAVVVVIMVLAVIYRLEHIYSSLHHDEAYTYVAFARSLFAAVTDYHLPNNHVFHSILVYFSTKIFGIQPWAVRLPALVAGVLLVPAAYWLAKRLYDRWTALGAALLVAWFPPLIAYSNNARGYTLVALFTLLIFSLGDLVRKEKNLFAWSLISLFSALGLYTVPVMLFPFGALFVWLFLENQVMDATVSTQSDGIGPYHNRWEFLRYWLTTGFGVAILTILLYLPILVYTSPQKLFANGFVAPLPWADLVETLSHRFAETWAEWTFRVPPVIVLLFAAGWTLSLLFHWRLSGTRLPLQLAAFLWIVILLLIQRPNAWSKVWVFLQPLMLIWAAAGIFGWLQKVHLKFVRGLPLAVIVFSVVLFAGIWQAVRLVPQLPELWAIKGEEEKSVLFVQSQLRDDDLIIVSSPVGAAVLYYAEVYGIPNTHFDHRNSTFERAWVLVDLAENQTPASVIAERGPDQIILDIKSAHLLETFGNLEVFEIPRQ